MDLHRPGFTLLTDLGSATEAAPLEIKQCDPLSLLEQGTVANVVESYTFSFTCVAVPSAWACSQRLSLFITDDEVKPEENVDLYGSYSNYHILSKTLSCYDL